MPRFSSEPRTRKYVRGYGFLSFGRNLTNKYGKQLLDFATKTRVDPLKTASQKVTHKVTEGTGEFIGNKIVDKTLKPKPVPDVNSINVEEIVIPPEKREEILNELEKKKLKKYQKMKHHEISKLLSDLNY